MPANTTAAAATSKPRSPISSPAAVAATPSPQTRSDERHHHHHHHRLLHHSEEHDHLKQLAQVRARSGPAPPSLTRGGGRGGRGASGGSAAVPSSQFRAGSAVIATDWPVPSWPVRPFTQLFAHVASTSIMVLLVIFSFVEDIGRYISSLLPAAVSAATPPPLGPGASPTPSASDFPVVASPPAAHESHTSHPLATLPPLPLVDPSATDSPALSYSSPTLPPPPAPPIHRILSHTHVVGPAAAAASPSKPAGSPTPSPTARRNKHARRRSDRPRKQPTAGTSSSSSSSSSSSEDATTAGAGSDDTDPATDNDVYYVDDDAAERDGSTIIVKSTHATPLLAASSTHMLLLHPASAAAGGSAAGAGLDTGAGAGPTLSAAVGTALSTGHRSRRVSTDDRDAGTATFTAEDLSRRKITMRVEDYCEHAGYSCEAIETATDDGFVLVVHHIGRKDGAPPDRGPVILMHGLFQSAGVWVTNGRSSFAFYLVDQGYDVWLGNNRTVFPRHLRYHPSSPAFWNWSLDDLAIHDIPTLLALVRHKTRRPRVAYVGHSQGNSQMFLALALNPSLNAHLSVFVALAPAVYLGPLLDSFPVNLLMRCPSALYRRLFGVKGFLPVMGVVQRWAPPMVFMTLAYHMFHYLFGWTDTNWNPANKPAYFQFTPRPQSAKLLHHWAQMGSAKVVQPFRAQHPPSPASASASPATPHYDVTAVRCPLALYYGTKDTIVDARRLHRECWAARGRGVRLVAVEEVDGYEHMDCLWAVDAGAKVWRRVVKVLEGVEEVEMERAAASR